MDEETLETLRVIRGTEPKQEPRAGPRAKEGRASITSKEGTKVKEEEKKRKRRKEKERKEKKQEKKNKGKIKNEK
jgi:hypothetical protein